MSRRASAFLFLVALVLAALVYRLEFQTLPEDDALGSGQEDLFPELEARDVEWIELTTTDGDRLRADRTPQGWFIVGPNPGPADSVAFEAAGSQLASLLVEGRVPAPVRAEDFGVDDSVVPLRFGAKGRTHELRFGKATPVGGHTYVRSDSQSDVAWVATWRANALRKKELGWRDRRVLDFDRTAVQKIRVQWSGGGATILRQRDGWRLTDPLSERADASGVEGLLTQLSFVEADGWVDERARVDAEAALKDPFLAFELETDDGEPSRWFAIAPREGEPEWVASGQGGRLFLLSTDRVSDLPRRLFDFRHKALGEFDLTAARGIQWVLASAEAAGQGTRFEADWRDGRWRPRDERVDPVKLRRAVEAISSLQASGIVADGLGAQEREALGLETGNLRVRVTGEGGRILTELVFGRVEVGQGWWVSPVGSQTVYRVDEALVEFLPVDAADFQARFVIPPAGESISNDVSPEG